MEARSVTQDARLPHIGSPFCQNGVPNRVRGVALAFLRSSTGALPLASYIGEETTQNPNSFLKSTFVDYISNAAHRLPLRNTFPDSRTIPSARPALQELRECSISSVDQACPYTQHTLKTTSAPARTCGKARDFYTQGGLPDALVFTTVAGEWLNFSGPLDTVWTSHDKWSLWLVWEQYHICTCPFAH